MPRFSIVTPTFRQAGTIRQTIESVLGQESADLEYWVIDGGSEDGTVEILREYANDARFHWVSEPDRGQSDAINKGLARATGEIFNWINSDDYLAPGALARVAAVFRQNPDAGIVSGRTAEFRGNPAQVFNQIELQVRARAEETIPVGVFCQPSTFWRMEVVRSLGWIDASLHCVMDWNLWVRYLALHGQDKVRKIDDLFAYFRHHEAAKTTANSEKFYEETKTIFHQLHQALHAPAPFLFPEVEADPAWTRRDFQLAPSFDRERYLGAYAERMVRIHRKENPALAKAWLARAWTYRPWITPWRLKMAVRLLFQ